MSLATRIARALSFIPPVRASDNRPRVIGETDKSRGFDWKSAVADALIVAGLNFFSALAGLTATQVVSNPVKVLVAAGISAGLGFFSTLAFKRGLRERV